MMKNKETWVAVDGHGNELAFPERPYRSFPNMNLSVQWGRGWTIGDLGNGVMLPTGSIELLTGKKMTYSDEPIKIIG